MERIKRIGTKNVAIIIYVIFFVCFASIAVWDAKEIITDYVQDNRITLVKRKNSLENAFPFLDAPKICLVYNHPFIPEISWKNFSALLNDSWHQREIGWLKNMSNSSISAYSKIFDMIKYSIFGTPSDDRYYLITDMADILGIKTDKLLILMHNFVQNQKSINLIRQASNDKAFISRFVEKTRKTSNDIITNNVYFYPTTGDDFGLSVCFLIPLVDDLMELNQTSLVYELDSVDLNDKIAEQTAQKIRLDFLDDLHEVRNVPNDYETIVIFYKISNSEILDAKRFSPCGSEFKNENDCFDNLWDLLIETNCNCTMISKAYFGNESRQDQSKPICLSQSANFYEQCSQKAMKEFSRQKSMPVENRVCGKLCLSATNSVKVSPHVTFFARHDDQQTAPRYTIEFACKETYLVFEEKVQFNFSQLVSQIGGDLGLYIGFSMISLLQSILFLYNMHQQQRRNRRTQMNGSTSPSKSTDWFRFCLQYVTKSFKNTDQEENSSRLQELQVNMQGFQDFQRDTTRRLVSLEQKIEQLLTSQRNQWNTRAVFHNIRVQNDDDESQQTKL